MRAVDLFAGMGGFGLAAQQAGAEVVYANEFDRYAADLHDANFDVKVDRRSISDVGAEEIPAHDVVLAGWPCQPFSIAGRQGGFADERGRLFPEVLRIATAHRSPLIVGENVKQYLTHDGGRTMETTLRWLREAGYGVAYGVLRSWRHAGIPQARERLYLVAALGQEVPQDVLPLPLDGLPDPRWENVWRRHLDSPESVPARYWYPPGSPMSGLFERSGAEDPDLVYKFHRANELRSSGLVPTMMANMGTGGGKVPMVLDGATSDVFIPRKFTERECARLQGFPDSYALDAVSPTRQFKAIGNAVTVTLAQRVVENAIRLIV